MKKGLQGMENVIKNLNLQAKQMKILSVPGLIECAIVVRRDVEMVSPTIPVDTGNLRHSFFTVVTAGNGQVQQQDASGTMNSETKQRHSVVTAAAKSAVGRQTDPALLMGFSANYAIPVHEDMTATFKRPGSGPKFFEAAFKRNANKFLKILAKHVKAQ